MPDVDLVEEAKTFLASWKGAADGESAPFAFLKHLAQAGKMRTFPEEEWYEAGQVFELNDDEIGAWVEGAACWPPNDP
jgi:hypothetical protein